MSNTRKPSNDGDALFGSNPKGRVGLGSFLRSSPLPYISYAFGLVP